MSADFTPVLNLIFLLLVNVFFLAVVCGLVWLVMRQRHAFLAVLRRNFVSYFSNPTGYVFLCLFVLLSSVAAFWTYEFFAQNLANLNQLSKWFPYIMLVFIPAITMSIWADERRQGTDELLLTIPASDWDIVLGKYFAALAVYTVSLLFSEFSNFVVLNLLARGRLDTGLIGANYLGYWFVGATMLSIGMVASFLTKNLTVGFVLGVLFNIPLVFLGMVDAIIPTRTVSTYVSRWGIGTQFAGFGRGVVSLSSASYFVLVIALGLYLSSVLIGRRHWMGGKDGQSLFGHYLVRTLAMVATVIGANFLLTHVDLTRDLTLAQVSSLSPDTKRILADLQKTKRPVTIEAFVSQSVPPEDYAQTKIDLTNLLAEFNRNKNVNVIVHDNLEPFSEEAVLAEEQFGIKPQTVMTRERGTLKEEQLFLGAAFTSGLEKVVVPFFDRGIPVEYELIRSIRTAAQQERKRIGVVKTDAELFGGFDMQTFRPREKQLIIEELEKQYEIVEVDASSKIDETLDVLLLVQPSSLPQPQLNNVIDAVRAGVPSAIFEDPMPLILASAPGTGQPRRPRGGGFMGMGQQPPEPKGDTTQLWEALGVEMVGERSSFGEGFSANVIWQDYTPYPKLGSLNQITPEWVFASNDAEGAEDAINKEDEVTSGIQEILFLYPGAVKEQGAKEGFKFSPLVSTGVLSGYISPEDADVRGSGRFEDVDFKRSQGATGRRYTLAARITGPLRPGAAPETGTDKDIGKQDDTSTEEAGPNATPDAADQPATSPADEPTKKREQIEAIYVCDIDLLSSDFLRVRQAPDPEFNWKFENVTFVLNVIDSLAKDEDFLEIRKRKSLPSTLAMVDDATADARAKAQEATTKFGEDFDATEKELRGEFEEEVKKTQEEIDALKEKLRLDPSSIELRRQIQQLQLQLEILRQTKEKELNVKIDQMRKDRDRQLKVIERELDRNISQVQNRYKLWAAFLPPLPLIIIGLAVYARLLSREKEGVSRERLR